MSRETKSPFRIKIGPTYTIHTSTSDVLGIRNRKPAKVDIRKPSIRTVKIVKKIQNSYYSPSSIGENV